ncbi:IS1595 family transposase [Kangiella sp. TOML190]|uniref:IS1595 family transposase n=1 Tax=Kangiella sp. TOML190 TaxID=2931351 RepID=UPI002041BB92|nr:IS1595 family transposase [Kangiella sp. TOML190]
MPQSYRLSSERRNFSLDDIDEMTEEKAMLFIAKSRWGSESEQVCPECGSFSKHYYKKTRKQWRCKHCNHTFSVTSSSVFAHKKIKYKKLLRLLFMFCNSAKGVSATELSGILGLSQKSSWLLCHKIREGLLRSRDESPLSGLIHIDGAYFGGKRRHGRKRRYRIAHKAYEARIATKGKVKLPLSPIQKRNLYKRKKNRRVVMSLREISSKSGQGATKTRIAVTRAEDEANVIKLCERFVAKGSTIWSDEHKAYNKLQSNYKHESVEHSEEFMSESGVHNNQAESYNSRLRRAEYGTFHGMRPQYMLDYAQEMAWREDTRRDTLLDQLSSLIRCVFSVGESVWWRGYHQGVRRNDELLAF